jgi:hypothetical protein
MQVVEGGETWLRSRVQARQVKPMDGDDVRRHGQARARQAVSVSVMRWRTAKTTVGGAAKEGTRAWWMGKMAGKAMTGGEAQRRGQALEGQAVRASGKVWQGIAKAKADGDWQMDGGVAKEWTLLRAGLAVGREARVAFQLGGRRRSVAAARFVCTRAWGLSQQWRGSGEHISHTGRRNRAHRWTGYASG